MANHVSAKKRAKQNEVRKLRNKSFVSRIKTALKNFSTSVEGKDAEKTQVSFKEVQSMLQKGVTKGLVHKNTAARKISRMSKRIV